MDPKKIPSDWYYDKRVGLVNADCTGYICRGIKNHECGYLLAAAPDLLRALELVETWMSLAVDFVPQDLSEKIDKAIDKAKGAVR